MTFNKRASFNIFNFGAPYLLFFTDGSRKGEDADYFSALAYASKHMNLVDNNMTPESRQFNHDNLNQPNHYEYIAVANVNHVRKLL